MGMSQCELDNSEPDLELMPDPSNVAQAQNRRETGDVIPVSLYVSILFPRETPPGPAVLNPLMVNFVSLGNISLFTLAIRARLFSREIIGGN